MKTMPIYLNKLTFKLKNYSTKKGTLFLQKKEKEYTTKKVCLGKTLEELNNSVYNSYTINSLKNNYGKTHGCELKIIKVEPISYHGQTSKRFIN